MYIDPPSPLLSDGVMLAVYIDPSPLLSDGVMLAVYIDPSPLLSDSVMLAVYIDPSPLLSDSILLAVYNVRFVAVILDAFLTQFYVEIIICNSTLKVLPHPLYRMRRDSINDNGRFISLLGLIPKKNF